MHIHLFSKISTLVYLLSAGIVQYAHADSAESWSGYYIGGSAGYGWADISGYYTYGPSIGSATAKGETLGIQVGYDYQSSDWVWGPQLSYEWTNMSGDHRFIHGSGPRNFVTYDIDSLITLTARVGYLVDEKTLTYIKGGWALANTNYDDSDPALPYTGNEKVSRNGWIAGFGLEHKFLRDLSAFAEYSHMDFGSETITIHYSDGIIDDYTFKQNMSRILLGVNYRF